jgi:leucyl aminopeptidase (aminopeptidase T)
MLIEHLSASKAPWELRRRDFALLDSVEQLRSVAHEERLALMTALTAAPLTGTMVAKHLGLPVTRVHYHLQRLLEGGLIQEAGRGRKRWKEERYYVTSARHFLIHPRLGCQDADTTAALERFAQAAFLEWRRRDVLGIDLAAVARLVIHDSLGVRPGEHVLVLFGPPSDELGETLMIELEASGAQAIARHWSRNTVLRTLDRYSAETLAEHAFLPPELDAKLDAVIFVSSSAPEGGPPNEAQRAKLPLLMEAVSRWHRSLRARGVRYLEVALPHRGELEGGSLEPEAAVDVYWRSLIADPKAMTRRGAALLARIRGHSAGAATERVAIELSGPGTDLRLEIDPNRAFLNDGVLTDEDLAAGRTFDALPAGTLSFLPLPLTVSGTFTAGYTFTGGHHFPRVHLVLREGRIVEIDADHGASDLRQRLASAAGDANLIAEVGIGLNPARAESEEWTAPAAPVGLAPAGPTPAGLTGKPVLDSCLMGMVTLGFGNNELLGGDVHSTLNLVLPAPALTLRAGDEEIIRDGSLITR